MYLSKKDINNIRGAIRQSYHISEHYKGFIKLRRIEIPNYRKDGTRANRDSVRYKCDSCQELVSGTNMDVDHIVPIGSFKSLDEIESFVKKVYCSYDNLQILCGECHRHKTNMDRDFSRLVF